MPMDTIILCHRISVLATLLRIANDICDDNCQSPDVVQSAVLQQDVNYLLLLYQLKTFVFRCQLTTAHCDFCLFAQ